MANGKKEIAIPFKVKHVTYVTTQQDVVFIIDENDKLWTFGNGHSGTLGHGNTDNKEAPTVVDALKNLNVKQVSGSHGPCDMAQISSYAQQRTAERLHGAIVVQLD